MFIAATMGPLFHAGLSVPCFPWLSWAMESCTNVTGWWGNNNKDEDPKTSVLNKGLFVKTPAGLVNHGKLQWTQKNNHILVCFCCICCHFCCFAVLPLDGSDDFAFFKERKESNLFKETFTKRPFASEFVRLLSWPSRLRDFVTCRVAIKNFPRFVLSLRVDLKALRKRHRWQRNIVTSCFWEGNAVRSRVSLWVCPALKGWILHKRFVNDFSGELWGLGSANVKKT